MDSSLALVILQGTVPWLHSYQVSDLTGYNILIQLTIPAGLRMASSYLPQSLCLPGVLRLHRKFIHSVLSVQEERISQHKSHS